MNKIKQYTIVFDLAPNDLIKKVNDMIKDGWQPIGGIALGIMHPEGDHQKTIQLQAMVKEN